MITDGWKRSSFCESGTCIEVANLGSWVNVRLAQAPWMSILATPEEWAALVAGIKNGEFDLPELHG